LKWLRSQKGTLNSSNLVQVDVVADDTSVVVVVVVVLLLLLFLFYFSTSQIISRGYLNFLEKTNDVWTKVYVVIRRPYLYIYDHEDDPVERMVINISFAKVMYSEDQAALLQVFNFSWFIPPAVWCLQPSFPFSSKLETQHLFTVYQVHRLSVPGRQRDSSWGLALRNRPALGGTAEIPLGYHNWRRPELFLVQK